MEHLHWLKYRCFFDTTKGRETVEDKDQAGQSFKSKFQSGILTIDRFTNSVSERYNESATGVSLSLMVTALDEFQFLGLHKTANTLSSK